MGFLRRLSPEFLLLLVLSKIVTRENFVFYEDEMIRVLVLAVKQKEHLGADEIV